MNDTTTADSEPQPAVGAPVERPVRPCAWMAMAYGVPAQATTDEPTAIRWRKAGGDVMELYDGQTLWNAVARAAELERERSSQAMAVLRQIADMPRRTREQRLAKSCVEFLDCLD